MIKAENIGPQIIVPIVSCSMCFILYFIDYYNLELYFMCRINDIVCVAYITHSSWFLKMTNKNKYCSFLKKYSVSVICWFLLFVNTHYSTKKKKTHTNCLSLLSIETHLWIRFWFKCIHIYCFGIKNVRIHFNYCNIVITTFYVLHKKELNWVSFGFNLKHVWKAVSLSYIHLVVLVIVV